MVDSSRRDKDDAHVRISARILEALRLVIEGLQLVPLILLNTGNKLPYCDHVDLFDPDCIFVLVTNPLLLLAETTTEGAHGRTGSVYMVLSLVLAVLVFASAGSGILVAQTFRSRQINLAAPIFVIKFFCIVLATTYYTSLTVTLMMCFSCATLESVIGPDFLCNSYLHIFAQAASLLALILLLAMSIVVALLYNKFDQFSQSQSAAAHGRVEVWVVIMKTVVAANRITLDSYEGHEDLETWTRYCSVANFILLALVAVLTAVQSPSYCDFVNKLRVAIFSALAFGALYPLSHNIYLTAALVTLALLIGLSPAGVYRKYYFVRLLERSWSEVYENYDEEYRNLLLSALYSEVERPRGQFAGGAVDNLQRDSISFMRGGDDDQKSHATSTMVNRLQSGYKARLVRKSVYWDTDIELMLRAIRDRWYDFSDKEKEVIRVLVDELFYFLLRGRLSTAQRAFTYAWYALTCRVLFNETFGVYRFIRYANQNSNTFQIDVPYICYYLSKDIETARQATYLMGGLGTRKLTLIDLMTYKKWSVAAKVNHLRALELLVKFWRMSSQHTAQIKPQAKVLHNALVALRTAEGAYMNLLSRFPKAPEALDLYAAFVRNVMLDEKRAEVLLQNDLAESSSQYSSSHHSSSIGRNLLLVGMDRKLERVMSIEQKKMRALHWIKAMTLLALVVFVVMSFVSHHLGMTEQTYVTEKMVELDHHGSLMNSWSETCIHLNKLIIYKDTDHRLHPRARELLLEQDDELHSHAEMISTAVSDISTLAAKDKMADVLSKINKAYLNVTYFRQDGSRASRVMNFNELASKYAFAIRTVADQARRIPDEEPLPDSPEFRFISENCVGPIPDEGFRILLLQLAHVQDAITTAVLVLSLASTAVLVFGLLVCLGTLKLIQARLLEFDRRQENGAPVALQICHELTGVQSRKLRRLYIKSYRKPFGEDADEQGSLGSEATDAKPPAPASAKTSLSLPAKRKKVAAAAEEDQGGGLAGQFDHFFRTEQRSREVAPPEGHPLRDRQPTAKTIATNVTNVTRGESTEQDVPDLPAPAPCGQEVFPSGQEEEEEKERPHEAADLAEPPDRLRDAAVPSHRGAWEQSPRAALEPTFGDLLGLTEGNLKAYQVWVEDMCGPCTVRGRKVNWHLAEVLGLKTDQSDTGEDIEFKLWLRGQVVVEEAAAETQQEAAGGGFFRRATSRASTLQAATAGAEPLEELRRRTRSYTGGDEIEQNIQRLAGSRGHSQSSSARPPRRESSPEDEATDGHRSTSVERPRSDRQRSGGLSCDPVCPDAKMTGVGAGTPFSTPPPAPASPTQRQEQPHLPGGFATKPIPPAAVHRDKVAKPPVVPPRPEEHRHEKYHHSHAPKHQQAAASASKEPPILMGPVCCPKPCRLIMTRLYTYSAACLSALLGRFSRYTTAGWLTILVFFMVRHIIATVLLQEMGSKKVELSEVKELQLHTRQVVALLPDIIYPPYKPRLQWQVDQRREEFQHTLALAKHDFIQLLHGHVDEDHLEAEDAMDRRHPSRRELLYEPGCLLSRDNVHEPHGCTDRQHPYLLSRRLEEGLYEGVVIWMKYAGHVYSMYHDKYAAALGTHRRRLLDPPARRLSTEFSTPPRGFPLPQSLVNATMSALQPLLRRFKVSRRRTRPARRGTRSRRTRRQLMADPFAQNPFDPSEFADEINLMFHRTIESLPEDVTFTHPPEFWFLTQALSFDLRDGLFSLEETILEEARDDVKANDQLSWVLAGVAIALIMAGMALVEVLTRSMMTQVKNACAVLKTIPIDSQKAVLAKVFADYSDVESEEDADEDADEDPFSR
ncbi:unnamed protein product [Vitrella brassicaformis CCMP3155]|uniref:TmcB/TmcC TPR repeats domain-containing protein n=4 Tax=Vitrella brassicaformis TaxID=1169539 RepID=A0A0G4ED70_VITBC|nr:unnamed protein product [Vitrella brassicaformis CCMP3155]|eukprot:CEL93295.1 unnamed protein product [Vitrella brassicaformis CCMP3155]